MEEQRPDPELDDLTYSRLNLNDHTLEGNLPPPQCSSNTKRARLPSTNGVGVLDALPLELMQAILSGLDLCSLMDFMCVNRRAEDLVNSLPQYRAINTHASGALRGILSIGTGRWITCRTLYEKLCSPGCAQCNDFASYLYLLTCKRVCFLCLSTDQIYLPLSPGRASCKFGLDGSVVNTLPRMKVIPGIYSPNEKKVRAPSVLVDYESAFHAGVLVHGSLGAMYSFAAKAEARKLQAYKTRLEVAQQFEPATRCIRRPRNPDPFDAESGNPFRFVAIVEIPVDPDDTSKFRILVENKFIKYITIDAGLCSNKARVSRNTETGCPYFAAVSKTQLPGIVQTWHPTRIDHLTLRMEEKLRTNVYEVICPGFNHVVIAKFARFECEVPQLEAETMAYGWIEGNEIGPVFLGHLTEEGRVIGFLIDRVTDCRHADIGDLPPVPLGFV
ncbi:hypothetical protein HJFPF1_05076 [Paramyrothecium foliicola]|nr:hypothetical protein HJFPF1_05076 [Paramyrothecium foliicola]